MSSIENARKTINSVDRQMAELFVKRMEAAEQVFEYKKEHGLPILDEKREKELIKANCSYIENSVYRQYYIDFLQNTMDISKKYQYRLQSGLKIAYSGVPGAFAHIAASRIFPDAVLVAHSDFESTYSSVESGECDAAVLPIENSYAGEVGNVVDMLFGGNLYINGIYSLEVMQNLLGVKGATKDDVKTVISHEQALNQCAEYIREKSFEKHEASNTAYAALKVAQNGDKTCAAIASAETAELYNLEILDRNINKSNVNTTRFAVVSRVMEKNSAYTNSVIMFTVSNVAGALAKAINIIGKHGFNMTVLRSRPLKDHPWRYYFYIETDRSAVTDDGEKMIDELKECCDRLKIAGTFAEGVKL